MATRRGKRVLVRRPWTRFAAARKGMVLQRCIHARSLRGWRRHRRLLTSTTFQRRPRQLGAYGDVAHPSPVRQPSSPRHSCPEHSGRVPLSYPLRFIECDSSLLHQRPDSDNLRRAERRIAAHWVTVQRIVPHGITHTEGSTSRGHAVSSRLSPESSARCGRSDRQSVGRAALPHSAAR
jgi:hypothetical protein